MAHGLNWGRPWQTEAREAGRSNSAPRCIGANGGNLRFSWLPQLLSGLGQNWGKLGRTGAQKWPASVPQLYPLTGGYNWGLTGAATVTVVDWGKPTHRARFKAGRYNPIHTPSIQGWRKLAGRK